MKVRKTPERRCLGCNVSYPKSELIRVVRTPEGNVELDLTGRKNGRGAYICKKADCFRAARKKNRFSQNLGVEIPTEILDGIEAQIAECEKEGSEDNA
ncbi:MAG: YlxR family protein [Ruminococcaceae bacterium]|nr:YlxR family protein [Oscillospiraceae bacterium]